MSDTWKNKGTEVADLPDDAFFGVVDESRSPASNQFVYIKKSSLQALLQGSTLLNDTAEVLSGAVSIDAENSDAVFKHISVNNNISSIAFTNADNLKFVVLEFLEINTASRTIEFSTNNIIDGTNDDSTELTINADERLFAIAIKVGTTYIWTISRKITASGGTGFSSAQAATSESGSVSLDVSSAYDYATEITVTGNITALAFTNNSNLVRIDLLFTASGAARNIDFGSGFVFDTSNYDATDFDIEQNESVRVIGFYDGTNWQCTLLSNQARSQQITASASMALNVNTAPYAYLNESLDAAAVNTATLNITNIKEHTENKRIGQIVFDAPDGETVNFQLNGATTNVRVVDGATASSAVLGTGTEDIFTFEYVRSNPTTVILLITQISL